MIRNAQVLIAYPLLRDSKLAAELDSLPCVEDWIEKVIREALDKRPEIADLANELEKAKAKARKTWKERHGLLPKQDDQLP